MINQLGEQFITVLSEGDLGPDNEGGFGPDSEQEKQAVNDAAKEKYVAPTTIEIHCMDDGFEGAAAQLAGGLLGTEMASDYMSKDAGVMPLDKMTEAKTSSLTARGRPVIVHGDTQHGKGGCAALTLIRGSLVYAGNHADVVAARAWERIEPLGVSRFLRSDAPHRAIATGAKRAYEKGYWSKAATGEHISAEDIVNIAQSGGAEYEEFDRRHNVGCSRFDLTGNVFDNGKFRSEHQTDQGEPLGVLSITLGAYFNQLHEDGFSDREAAEKIMHAAIFSISLLKMITKPGVKDIVVV